MKRILILISFLVCAVFAQAQPFGTIANSESGSSVRTKLNNALMYLDTLGLDIEFSADNLSFHYPWASNDIYIRLSDDFGTTWSDAFFLWGGDSLSKTVIDTLIVGGDTLVDFTQGVGWDSLTWNETTEHWWNKG